MPELNNIRFLKNDDYGSRVFIANSQKEPDTFAKLKEIYTKLKKTYPDQFLPVFCNEKHKYATIKFKINDTFEKNDVYELDFVVKKKAIDDKIYINCFLNKSILKSKALPTDDGEELDF